MEAFSSFQYGAPPMPKEQTSPPRSCFLLSHGGRVGERRFPLPWTAVRGWLLWAACLGLAACGGESNVPEAGGEASAKVHRSGAAIYARYCFSCHAAGVAGAPKTGDAEAWTPRLANGQDALLRSTIDGMVGMPAMGLCFDCSEQELADAIGHMSGMAMAP